MNTISFAIVLILLALASSAFRKQKKQECPARIKAITRVPVDYRDTTRNSLEYRKASSIEVDYREVR